ncbi:MAG: TlyA family RNA methyltransferase [Rhodobiaceae bacterium]|nr:TlyA family RNA methyltransferase [Rhodobiaceae bacterium]MCC0041837.1 TlyA family RNA methyltransferase [Rhodobiaceae bacterium]
MRLDEALVARGLAPSRSRARDQVLRGCVSVEGRIETKPARMVATSADIAVADPAGEYVSRSALKLVAGLDAAGFDVAGCHALDVGASTGGFTQVLLERGAAHVVALDVGSGQIAAPLREDARVTVMEGVNAREVLPVHLPYAPDLVVADVSFISLKFVLPVVLGLAATHARAVVLFKPQFEVGREALGKGGIVRDDAAAAAAFEAVGDLILQLGWRIVATCESPIAGGDGNRERLICARHASVPAASTSPLS